MAKLNVTLDIATETELGGVLSSSNDYEVSVDPDTGYATINNLEIVMEMLDLISGEVI
jgi:flagellar basal body rod protein FlgC